MKICLFADARSVHVQRISAGLAARGVNVHIVTHKPMTVEGATVEAFRIPPASLMNPRRWHSRWRLYLRDFMKRFDVVHVHFLSPWGFTPEIIDDGCFVASTWGSDIVQPPGEGRPTDSVIEERKMMLKCAAKVTAWGPYLARTTANFAQIDQSEISLLPLGVDLDLFQPMKSTPKPVGSPHKVGFFKGFRLVYGATFLMRAIPTVLSEFPKTKFHMIGDGPELVKCKQLAGMHGVDFQINWIRRQSYGSLPGHLAGWDLSVVPSVCESFGAAALESSAMCVPVVASDVGGLHETVRDGETGWLVPAQAPEQLADAIIKALSDDDTRQAMGLAGRAMVQREYDWNTILDRWVETYQEARERAMCMV